ncbi:MAG: flavin reductase family protein [Burkholderiaceae bacterium]
MEISPMPVATPSKLPKSPGGPRFKQGMRALTSGVTVIGAYGPGGVAMAMTATSVTSLSADPPSLLVCVNRSASLAAALVKNARFSVNVLGADQIDIAKAFGGQLDVRGTGRFIYGNWHRVDDTEVPLLTGSRVSFECEVAHVHEWATHHIVIGSVLDLHFSRTAGQSLAFADGKYHPVG